MDTTRDIEYRGFLLNDAAIRDSIEPGPGIGKGIDGSVVDSFDPSDKDVVQFLEKRALRDGMDAGDVFYGARRIRMAGTLYGSTRALFYDKVDAFFEATNAVLAQREEPANKGFVPLKWSKPTNRAADYPEGIIALQVFARPAMSQVIIQRDQHGGDDSHGLSVPWQASWIMRDPVIYSQEVQDIDLSGGGTVAGNFTNRGNYIGSLNLLVQVGAAAGSIAITAGGATITISVPASTGNRIIRYVGPEKQLFFEENSVEVLRMDKLILPSSGSHPIIPPGTSAYTVTFNTVVPQAGSHMWFYEAYS